jgi:amino acid transporter
MGAIAGAAISAFFCFGGWWEAGKIAGDVRNPRRTLPIAFTAGVLIVTAVYLLVSFAFVAVVPMEQIQNNTAFVAQFGQALFGAQGGRVLSACVLLCVLGGLMVLSMAVPRVTYALAREEAGMAMPIRPAGLLRPPSSPLRFARQRRPAANRHGPRGACPGRLRPHPRLHHLFRGRLSGAHRGHALPRRSR